MGREISAKVGSVAVLKAIAPGYAVGIGGINPSLVFVRSPEIFHLSRIRRKHSVSKFRPVFAESGY